MRQQIAVQLTALVIAAGAHAATLTITPDKQVYQIGEMITLHVIGDAEGGQDAFIFGRISFDASLAEYVSSQQEALTSLGGGLPWVVLEPLTGGGGFADAFRQTPPTLNPLPVDGPLTATVTLLATAPGTLEYAWATMPPEFSLDFFDLFDAPGGSVTIVPEPASGALLVLGLAAFTLGRRHRSH